MYIVHGRGPVVMVNFFVLDAAGDCELETETDEFGEATYNYVDYNKSMLKTEETKKFKKIESLKQAKIMLKPQLYVCKLKGYPEFCFKSIMGCRDTTNILLLNNWQTLKLNNDLIVFKAISINVQLRCKTLIIVFR